MEPTGNDKTVTKVGEVYQTPEQAEADVKRICTAPERQVRLTAAVGATEYPIISILLETVSPENNDASAFASVMAWWGLERSA